MFSEPDNIQTLYESKDFYVLIKTNKLQSFRRFTTKFSEENSYRFQ